MILTNQLIVIFLGLAAIVGIILLFIKLKKDPQNAGKEMGLVASEAVIRYPMTLMFGFLLAFNLAEAFLAAGFAHSEISPLARMLTHSSMAALSVVAGLVWIKEITNLGEAIKGRNVWDVLISLGLVLIVTLLSIGTPFCNMIIIANNLHEIEALSLFWDRIRMALGLLSSRAYMAQLYGLGKPLTYSAFANLSPVMMATIFVTITHILLVTWEALKVARSKRESVRSSLRSDLHEDPEKTEDKDKEKNKDKDKEKDKDKDKEKDKPNKFQNVISRIFEFVGVDPKKIDALVNQADRITASQDDNIQAVITQTMGNFLLMIDEAKKKNAPEAELDVLRNLIVQVVRFGPRIRDFDIKGKTTQVAGFGMTLRAKN